MSARWASLSQDAAPEVYDSNFFLSCYLFYFPEPRMPQKQGNSLHPELLDSPRNH